MFSRHHLIGRLTPVSTMQYNEAFGALGRPACRADLKPLDEFSDTHRASNGKALGDITTQLAKVIKTLLILDAFSNNRTAQRMS